MSGAAHRGGFRSWRLICLQLPLTVMSEAVILIGAAASWWRERAEGSL
jgi:hypothetical protein